MHKIGLKFINRTIVEELFMDKISETIEIVRESFIQYSKGKVLLPDKISQVFDETTQNRINCLPATLVEKKVSGVKWVSVFPSNAEKGLLNLTGVMILSSLETGYPLAIVDGTYATALRTAAVGALAAKLLSRENSKIIGLIGAGEQAYMHFKLISEVRSIEACYVASKTFNSELTLINKLKKEYPNINFIACNSDYCRASKKSDIIVTAVSCQKPLLKANCIKEGTTYIHVGGWEDEYEVALKADKIICDNWENVKHRSQTISRMYQENILKDEDIYADLDEIIVGSKIGREKENEFIYFNSVGLAYIDVMFANYIYLNSVNNNKVINLNL